MPGSTAQTDRAEIQAALLGVLAQVETIRQGAEAILSALIPALESAGSPDANSIALAVRDRDGVTLHVLAQTGDHRPWPAAIEPRFSVGALSGVEATTGAVIVPLRANGRVVGALLIIDAIFATAIQRDSFVTELLQTAATVLEELVYRTDGLITRRARAMRSVESVIEGIAHQLANPLTGASAMAQLLAEEIQDSEQRAAMKQIVTELARATVVLRDLSDFHRQTGAQGGILDLNAVAEGIARFRGYAIREQGITFDFHAMSEPAPVRVDARSLEHALLVALRHAELRAHDSASRIICMRVVERDAGDVRLEINYSSGGLEPDLSSSYFDVRFRDELTTGAVVTDADLGLAASVLHRAGGRLEVLGSATDGATLAFIFPRAVPSNYSVEGRIT